jgi:hypothetical protein
MPVFALLGLSLLLAPADRPSKIEDGRLRWTDDHSEVALFGVNYYAPFCIDYAALGTLGLDRRQVIDQDVAHFRRLGLTMVRLHCFDREFSDAEGNLLENDHLALLDHLLAECRRNGIYAVLTPIAWWATPNPSPGFSHLFPMPQMTTDPGAPRAAQRRYLAQFVQHKNAETGLTYAADPQIVAFELINEPIYKPGTTDAEVTAYIDSLCDAIHATGCTKPLYYNGWGGRGKALAASGIDGVTNGWYPCGLQNGHTLLANMLPRVARYGGFDDPGLGQLPRGIYEFDAADTLRPCMYPAMARAFRAAGAQFAAQFQYDLWPLAASNCDWDTHYLSLPYTPGKALSFMIAAEAFRRLPRGEGAGPAGATRFGPFRVSYEQSLSEMVTDTEFLYANDTTTQPPAPEKLERVAGVGSSPAAQYDGAGAYFLERVGRGQWRLEVYPDAVVVDDPFGRTRLDREVTRLIWASRTMTLNLPDLGADFTVEPANAGNQCHPTVATGRFEVRPGVYLVGRAGVQWERRPTAEFFAPPEQPNLPPRAYHLPPETVAAGHPLTVEATVVPEDATPQLLLRTADGWQPRAMTRLSHYRWQAVLTPDDVKPGTLRHGILLTSGGHETFYPGGGPRPAAGPPAQPRLLWSRATTQAAPEGSELTADGLKQHTATGFAAEGAAAAVWVKAAAATGPAAGEWKVRVRARALEPATSAFELGLVQDENHAYGWEVPLATAWREVEKPLSELRPLWQTPGGHCAPEAITQLSLVYGAWLYGDRRAAAHGFEVARIELVPVEPGWAVPVVAGGPLVPLLRPAVTILKRLREGSMLLATGPDGQPTLELAHPGFGPPPDCTGLSLEPPASADGLATAGHLRVTARGLSPAATAFELVFVEADGAPWGLNVTLTADWQTLDLPLAKLSFWGGWEHPANRGGAGDRFHPEHLDHAQLTFGSWLNPTQTGQPWRIELAAVDLVP